MISLRYCSAYIVATVIITSSLWSSEAESGGILAAPSAPSSILKAPAHDNKLAEQNRRLTDRYNRQQLNARGKDLLQQYLTSAPTTDSTPLIDKLHLIINDWLLPQIDKAIRAAPTGDNYDDVLTIYYFLSDVLVPAANITSSCTLSPLPPLAELEQPIDDSTEPAQEPQQQRRRLLQKFRNHLENTLAELNNCSPVITAEITHSGDINQASVEVTSTSESGATEGSTVDSEGDSPTANRDEQAADNTSESAEINNDPPTTPESVETINSNSDADSTSEPPPIKPNSAQETTKKRNNEQTSTSSTATSNTPSNENAAPKGNNKPKSIPNKVKAPASKNAVPKGNNKPKSTPKKEKPTASKKIDAVTDGFKSLLPTKANKKRKKLKESAKKFFGF